MPSETFRKLYFGKKPFMICGMTLGWVGEVLREIQHIVCFVNINVSELALPPPIFFHAHWNQV